MNKKLLLYACLLVFFIWLVNTLANMFHWYSAMWWFDIPMHIMGGMFLALAISAAVFKKILPLSVGEALVTVMLFVLIAGIGWEFFEYFVQNIIKGSPQLANIPDSAKDMIMDLVGGLIASTFVLRRLKRYNKAHAN
jgi:hypothetical protein